MEVVFVDWSLGAALKLGWNPYDTPASNVRSIAAAVTDFFTRNVAFNRTKTHCIGFSLGSHVCGFTGKRLRDVGFQRWTRITALDPAWPQFDTDNIWARVDRSDGDFVDAIHSKSIL